MSPIGPKWAQREADILMWGGKDQVVKILKVMNGSLQGGLVALERAQAALSASGRAPDKPGRDRVLEIRRKARLAVVLRSAAAILSRKRGCEVPGLEAEAKLLKVWAFVHKAVKDRLRALEG